MLIRLCVGRHLSLKSGHLSHPPQKGSPRATQAYPSVIRTSIPSASLVIRGPKLRSYGLRNGFSRSKHQSFRSGKGSSSQNFEDSEAKKVLARQNFEFQGMEAVSLVPGTILLPEEFHLRSFQLISQQLRYIADPTTVLRRQPAGKAIYRLGLVVLEKQHSM